MNGSEVSSVFKLAASTLNLIVYAFSPFRRVDHLEA